MRLIIVDYGRVDCYSLLHRNWRKMSSQIFAEWMKTDQINIWTKITFKFNFVFTVTVLKYNEICQIFSYFVFLNPFFFVYYRNHCFKRNSDFSRCNIIVNIYTLYHNIMLYVFVVFPRVYKIKQATPVSMQQKITRSGMPFERRSNIRRVFRRLR